MVFRSLFFMIMFSLSLIFLFLPFVIEILFSALVIVALVVVGGGVVVVVVVVVVVGGKVGGVSSSREV